MKNIVINKINILIFIIICSFSCQSSSKKNEESLNETIQKYDVNDTAIFAGGCFWCVEASFEQIIGVSEVISGYSGGEKNDAYYKKVSNGTTDHTESVLILFDSTVISFEKLLEIFFVAHDPTQLNRQGPDVGTQYRSAVFYRNEKQKTLIENKIKEIQPNFPKQIVTLVVPFKAFYYAEDYHQDYIKYNPKQPYVVSVSIPKIKKVQKTFPNLLKKNN